MNAYGFIEISGVVAAVTALDIMCKTSNTELVTWERKWGGRLVTIIIRGEVAAVTEAIEAAKQNGISAPVATGVLANPHPEIIRLTEQSAKKFKLSSTPPKKGGTKNVTRSSGTNRNKRTNSGN